MEKRIRQSSFAQMFNNIVKPMGKTTKTIPAKDQNTEQLILNAARRVFTNKGFAAARMEDIAAEAGMNRALLHYYFRSKEKMFDMIFEENLQLFYGNFLAVLQQDVPFKDKIAMLVSTEIDTLLEHPEIPLFIVQEIARKPEQLKDKMKTIRIHRFVEEFGRQLTEETQRGNIRKVDPRQFFMSFMGMCIFPFIAKPMLKVVMQQKDSEFARLMEERKKEVTRTLLLSLEK